MLSRFDRPDGTRKHIREIEQNKNFLLTTRASAARISVFPRRGTAAAAPLGLPASDIPIALALPQAVSGASHAGKARRGASISRTYHIATEASWTTF